MIPQIGFSEMLLLGLLAIIVVGPKDLPKLMKAVGGFMARLRALGNEFKSAFDDMGADEEMAELRREIEELKQMGKLTGLDDDGEFDREMRDLNTELREGASLDNPKTDSPKGNAE